MRTVCDVTDSSHKGDKLTLPPARTGSSVTSYLAKLFDEIPRTIGDITTCPQGEGQRYASENIDTRKRTVDDVTTATLQPSIQGQVAGSQMSKSLFEGILIGFSLVPSLGLAEDWCQGDSGRIHENQDSIKLY